MAEDAWWTVGPLPGALRFLDGGGWATLASGLTEKLDIPGRWLFWVLGVVILLIVAGIAGAVVDERRVFAVDGFSLSPEDKLLGSAEAKAFCDFLDELHS